MKYSAAFANQSFDKIRNKYFEFGNRDLRSRTIDIVHPPVFDPFHPLGKVTADHWAMLNLLDGDDVSSGHKVVCGHRDRIANRFGEGNLQSLQGVNGVPGNRSRVERFQPQPTRIGNPVQLPPGCEPVEENLSNPSEVTLASGATTA